MTRILEPTKCDACDEMGVICYATEGDGTYWLCGKLDEDHSHEKYGGWIIGTHADQIAKERDDWRKEAKANRDDVMKALSSRDASLATVETLTAERDQLRGQLADSEDRQLIVNRSRSMMEAERDQLAARVGQMEAHRAALTEALKQIDASTDLAVIREVVRVSLLGASVETVLRAALSAPAVAACGGAREAAVKHVCCGCGGLCDAGEPCPMSYNCKCGKWSATPAPTGSDGAGKDGGE